MEPAFRFESLSEGVTGGYCSNFTETQYLGDDVHVFNMPIVSIRTACRPWYRSSIVTAELAPACLFRRLLRMCLGVHRAAAKSA